jgi:hypothetical protein
MPKQIDLGPGLKFRSITEAKTLFEEILKNTPIQQRVAAEEFENLKRLYEMYCAKTDWPLSSSPKAFFPTYEKQRGYTTKCFGVEFEDGNTGRFSLDKALRTVAN